MITTLVTAMAVITGMIAAVVAAMAVIMAIIMAAFVWLCGLRRTVTISCILAGSRDLKIEPDDMYDKQFVDLEQEVSNLIVITGAMAQRQRV